MATNELGITWPVEIHFRTGANNLLTGIDVFHDFNWPSEFKHNRSAFPNGKKLAQLVRKGCPSGKAATLLLTTDREPHVCICQTHERFIYIVDIRAYILLAVSDPALSFCLNASKTTISDLLNQPEFSLSTEDRTKLLNSIATEEALTQWATEDSRKVSIIASVAQRFSDTSGRTELRSDVARTLRESTIATADILEAAADLIEKVIAEELPSDKDPTALIRRLISVWASSAGIAETIEYISENRFTEQELEHALVARNRLGSITEYKRGLTENENEAFWQRWFKQNPWVLGSEVVRILDRRDIDCANIADFLVEAYDGHVDIIEIKTPKATFWAGTIDRHNWIPHQDLVKALTQTENYQFELEREMSLNKWTERHGASPIAKPRALLIHGRSTGWGPDKRRAQRLLNGSLSSVTVLTYDQVLARAERILMRSNNDIQDENDYKFPEDTNYEVPEEDDEDHLSDPRDEFGW